MHYITVTSTDRDGFVSGVDDHGRLRSAGLNRGAIIAVEAELERQRIDEDLPLGDISGRRLDHTVLRWCSG
jgi:hypothetical protein